MRTHLIKKKRLSFFQKEKVTSKVKQERGRQISPQFGLQSWRPGKIVIFLCSSSCLKEDFKWHSPMAASMQSDEATTLKASIRGVLDKPHQRPSVGQEVQKSQQVSEQAWSRSFFFPGVIAQGKAFWLSLQTSTNGNIWISWSLGENFGQDTQQQAQEAIKMNFANE